MVLTVIPHLSVTVALALTAADLGVLIYFIHHTATAIQLPEVIASIARDLARAIDAAIRLHHRPGHFLTQGHPVATVWPPEVAGTIGRRLEDVHITGPLRTLSQGVAFGIDQLVEIAIRAACQRS